MKETVSELVGMAATPFDRVMEDMLRGQDFAAQLQGLLRESPKAGNIIDQILQAFSNAIDAAKSMADEEGSEVQSGVICAHGDGGVKRKAAAAGGARDRRGTSRRRTQKSSVMVTTKDLEDGHAWRKYGQKEIQNTKHPKSYFRCTHKHDQLCAAQRQTQRCDEAPDTFRVTYIGVHTCRDPANVVPLVVQNNGADAANGLRARSRIISFAPNASATTTTASTTTTTGNANQQADLQESALPLKLEGAVDQEEVLSSLTPAGSARNPGATTGLDQGDVTSDLHFFSDGVDDLSFAMDDETFDLEDILRSW